ncbi:MAG TPA: hypothetical protein VH595_05640 [Verrucomicrobiae bacterium]|jgi:hypothetical protein|nr:hypothetical protein [Verrucomicrobiae bacterium]
MKLMKFVSVAAFAAILPYGISTARAVSASPIPLDGDSAVQAPQLRVEFHWDEGRKEKLRHAFWILEGADRDYHGHKAAAMEEIRKAGEIIGMDLHHGHGYGGERQPWSDARLREARGLLEDVASDSGGKEHEHIHKAIHELDHALEKH